MDVDTQPLPLPPLLARHQDHGLRPRRSPLAWLREQVVNYFPLLMLAVLAAASWWLVQHTPEAGADRTQAPLRHEPDYQMRGFSVQQYTAAGPARGVIEGDVVRHYPDTDELEIDGVRLRWADDEGHLMHATAARAIASADGRRVRLEGGARVRRDAVPGLRAELEFTSEVMLFDSDRSTVRSDRPVTLRDGVHRLQAGSLVYDHRAADLLLGGPVHGVLQPGVAVR
ncbi:lipopolysaccharide export system protein LptC [Sphaerotilus hippei]|uniref:Lipopolysaccharide export system protein LptC n=1 Tax=Sphaerotilus hippei TaxID=744406 RepID=A0A318H674_9BURK|nr:LPS export ABC transporter periplasmic protein LptC [Sphaerotilus hippei]PXW99477.1 lipopolysaccharide export system protein LptC [Sphaerotilus hippei]